MSTLGSRKMRRNENSGRAMEPQQLEKRDECSSRVMQQQEIVSSRVDCESFDQEMTQQYPERSIDFWPSNVATAASDGTGQVAHICMQPECAPFGRCMVQPPPGFPFVNAVHKQVPISARLSVFPDLNGEESVDKVQTFFWHLESIIGDREDGIKVFWLEMKIVPGSLAENVFNKAMRLFGESYDAIKSVLLDQLGVLYQADDEPSPVEHCQLSSEDQVSFELCGMAVISTETQNGSSIGLLTVAGTRIGIGPEKSLIDSGSAKEKREAIIGMNRQSDWPKRRRMRRAPAQKHDIRLGTIDKFEGWQAGFRRFGPERERRVPEFDGGMRRWVNQRMSNWRKGGSNPSNVRSRQFARDLQDRQEFWRKLKEAEYRRGSSRHHRSKFRRQYNEGPSGIGFGQMDRASRVSGRASVDTYAQPYRFTSVLLSAGHPQPFGKQGELPDSGRNLSKVGTTFL